MRELCAGDLQYRGKWGSRLTLSGRMLLHAFAFAFVGIVPHSGHLSGIARTSYQHLYRPSGAETLKSGYRALRSLRHPRLAPWAAVCRRSAAWKAIRDGPSLGRPDAAISVNLRSSVVNLLLHPAPS